MEKKNNIYYYQVLPREVDFTLKATLHTMCDYVLHTAGEDAERIGFSVDSLQQKNMTWVLSRMAIEMTRYPEQHEKYNIETWVEDVNRLMTTRNFILRDEAGETIGGASTNWAMIDFNTRKPLDLSANIDYANAVNPKPSPIEKPARIAPVKGFEVEKRTVRYSDIDFNHHTNSMKYLQWVIDAIPLDDMIAHTIRRADINFVHETKYGDEISLWSEPEERGYRFEIRKDDQPACKAAVCWKREE